MSTQRMPSKTSIFKLTVAVGLGLLGASGVALMSGGSTAEPFGIREARADGPFVLGGPGANGEVFEKPIEERDFTWGNGMTGLQFKRFAPLLCSSSTPALRADRERWNPSAPFASRMGDSDFRHWFHYIVRDGAPDGTQLIGVGTRGIRPDSTFKFDGGGGLKFSWLTSRLSPLQRRQALAGAATFVNDRGPDTIARYCSFCSGNQEELNASRGSIRGANPSIQTGARTSWHLELAFVGACDDGFHNFLLPRVRVFWSDRLRQALGVDKGHHADGIMRQDLEGRMCSDIFKENRKPEECPFLVEGSIEENCRIGNNKEMTCNYVTQEDCRNGSLKVPGSPKKKPVCVVTERSSGEAVYTFIKPHEAKKPQYRRP